MRRQLPENLIRLAEACGSPLYLVGGSVRDFLAGYPIGDQTDWDLSSPMAEDALTAAAEPLGFRVRAVFRRTGTVKLEDEEGRGYEFTRFRSDRYVRGLHTPSEITFTDDIVRDAKRRDFRANAVYYDVGRGEFVDPLGGVADIHARRLATVREAEKVFGEDGLRLMRLARIAAQTGFSPDEEALAGAARNAALIRDIAPERIFCELRLLLLSDGKHGEAEAPLRGLEILRDTTVLDHTMPELAAGKGLSQRVDFHAYDVLDHSLRCVRYAPPEIRFAALLHDVGKPYCFHRDGNFFHHSEEGARIAGEMLARLRAPVRLTEDTVFLVQEHMRDFDCRMRTAKVRREIVRMGDRLPMLLALKQADFSACKDDLSPAPTVVKWERVLEEMRAEGTPFAVKELALNGADLQRLGVPREKTAEMLALLLDFCTEDGSRNTRQKLEKFIEKRMG